MNLIVDISQPDTRDRELRALRKGLKHFGMKKGLILTYEAEEMTQHEGYQIEVRPVWKWLHNA